MCQLNIHDNIIARLQKKPLAPDILTAMMLTSGNIGIYSQDLLRSIYQNSIFQSIQISADVAD
jgi:hypothetical protein